MEPTLSAIPASADQIIGQPKEAVALDRRLEPVARSTGHWDLGGLIGSWQNDEGFDRAMADFGLTDEEGEVSEMPEQSKARTAWERRLVCGASRFVVRGSASKGLEILETLEVAFLESGGAQ